LNRLTLARACTALIATVAGTRLAGHPDLPSTAAAHAVYSRIGLSDSIAPRPVTLTPLSATRLGVSTALVTAAPGNTGSVRIPLAALIYDPQGLAWTYAVVGPHTYERVAVNVNHIDGDQVSIAAGPGAGTPVVDVGAPELLGVEYGVGKE